MQVLMIAVGGLVIVALVIRGAIAFYADFKNKPVVPTETKKEE